MSDPEGRPSVRELLADVPARVYPVGRLDFNTSGVLVATNDGDFAEGLLHPRQSVPKTYVVKLQGIMRDEDVDQWRHGIQLEDGKTGPAKVRLLRHEGDKTWLELTITEGRNQQVRRMGDATRFRVMRLARTSFAGISSEGLAPGRWRYLTADELTAMKKEHGVPRRVVSPPAPQAPTRARPVHIRPASSHSARSGGSPRASAPQPRPRSGGRESVGLASSKRPARVEKTGAAHGRRSERQPSSRRGDVLVEDNVVRQHVGKRKRSPRS
jgi:23S rRNA pseudouridine2605 synthase